MTLNDILLMGIFILSYFTPLIIISIRKERSIKETLKKAKTYNDIENFIQIKKYTFSKYEGSSIFLMGAAISVFIATKITGLLDIISTILITVAFIIGLSTYQYVTPIHKRIIEELYRLKDKQSKTIK